MPRRSSCLLSASFFVGCSLAVSSASAQDQPAPAPAEFAPAEPAPAEPAPEAPPPAEPPVSPPSPPPAESAPQPGAPAPPADGAFPAPAPLTPPGTASPPNAAARPEAPSPAPPAAAPPAAAPPAAAPPAAAPPAAAPPAAAPPAEQRALRPSEGLFTAVPPAEVRRHDDERDEDKVDHFKIGPVIGAGVPSIISFGGTLKVTRYLGAGVNVGLIPKVQLSYYGDATLSYQHYDIYGRIYPFGGGFFLGAGAGYATVDGTLTQSFTYGGYSGRYDSKGSVRTLMLTALLGYFYTTSIGFSIGVDAGAQIPIAPSQVEYGSGLSGLSSLPPELQQQIRDRYLTPSDRSVRDTLEKIGRTTLPTLNLRIGWIL